MIQVQVGDGTTFRLPSAEIKIPGEVKVWPPEAAAELVKRYRLRIMREVHPLFPVHPARRKHGVSQAMGEK